MSYFNRTTITDPNGVVVNPASDDTVILLRRIVKLLESNAVVDVANRQKVAVEVMPTTTVTGTVTVGAITSITTLNQLAGVDSRFQIIDWARQAYNSGIRSNLIFS